MISCRLSGTIGAQMFQMAAVIGYANKCNFEFAFPGPDNKNDRYFQNLPTISNKDLSNLTLCKEDEFDGFLGADNLCLDGLFQNTKYWDECIQYVIDLFNPDPTTQWHDISIHIRRNIKNPLPISYYQKAIDLISQKTNYHDYIISIYTDNVDWVKKNVNNSIFEDREFVIMTELTENDIENDLLLCSFSEHSIISNSKFSYWAALLNYNKHGIVIYPEPFNHENFTIPYLPNSFIKSIWP